MNPNENPLNFITGKLGSGKTLFLVALAYLNQSRPVFSNFKINLKNCQMLPRNLLDIIPNSIILLDEAYLYLDARNSLSEINKIFTKKFFQIRKKRSSLYIAIQLKRTIDVLIRDLKPTEIHAIRRKNSFHYLISSDMGNKHIKMSYNKALTLFGLYDSYQPIEIDRDDLLHEKSAEFITKIREIYRTGIFDECSSKTDIKIVLMDTHHPISFVDYIYSLLKRDKKSKIVVK